MKKLISAILSAVMFMSPLAYAKNKDKVHVHVTDRQDSNLSYSYAFADVNYGVAQNMSLRGATFTLALDNGDVAVVNCTSKFQERFAGPGNVRSCRVPLVNDLEVEFDGDKAKLFWSTSLDGKKTESETYKIVAAIKVQP